MARKSRLDLRKEAEAAEAMGVDEEKAPAKKKKKKKATKRKATKRTKVKAVIRKRLVWGVFSSSLKEEARFPYDQRKAADEKAAQLATKTKRTYFVQPIKEALPEPVKAETEAEE
jgi:hypothetical protein